MRRASRERHHRCRAELPANLTAAAPSHSQTHSESETRTCQTHAREVPGAGGRTRATRGRGRRASHTRIARTESRVRAGGRGRGAGAGESGEADADGPRDADALHEAHSFTARDARGVVVPSAPHRVAPHVLLLDSLCLFVVLGLLLRRQLVPQTPFAQEISLSNPSTFINESIKQLNTWMI